MKKQKADLHSTYINSTHRIGKISNSIAVLLILMVPAVITAVYGSGVKIQIANTISAIITLTAIYGTVSLVEVVSFSPFLGSGGTYLSFITGNIMNMKLPAATNALRVNNVERGTQEGEVITTLAIGASSVVTTVILFLGMLFLGRMLVPVITGPELASAFDNVAPALTGALAAPYFMLAFIVISFLCYLLFAAGSAANIIPERAILEGTLRAFRPEIKDKLVKRIHEVVHSVAKAYRTEAEIDVLSSVPPVECDEELNKEVADINKKLDDDINVLPLYHVMGSEDFAFISEKIPASYFCIGAGLDDKSQWYGQHNPNVRFNENCLPLGAAIYAGTAMDWLASHS